MLSFLGGLQFSKDVPDYDLNKATEVGTYSGWTTFSNTAFGNWTGLLTLLVLPKSNEGFTQIHFANDSGSMYLCVREFFNNEFSTWFKIQIPAVQ